MHDFRADLHCHTTSSDGTLSPKDLIQMASDKGLQGLSITDHDTIEAYKEGAAAALEKNIQLVPGVELSSMHRNTSVHILAYGFSLDSPIIKSFCDKHHERRKIRNQEMIELLAYHGMPLVPEDFPPELFSRDSRHTVGRPHIALAMCKKGYVRSIQEAFQKYIGDGKPCYLSRNSISVEETIGVIHEAKGLAVIAHPHLIERSRTVKDLLSMEFDGIEGYYARFPLSTNEKWLKIGLQKGWIITGGSDFHGEFKPSASLGSSWVNQETFTILQQRFLLNQRNAAR